MEEKRIKIGIIPAVIYGEKADKVYLYIHGKLGQKEEAADLAEIVCPNGFQVLAVDMPGHGERKEEIERFLPWEIVPELQMVMEWAKERWQSVSIRANSIGAYFSMLSFAEDTLENVLFVSPILDMVQLIENMMLWTGVSVSDLEKQKRIETPFGETLDWTYYQYAKSHVIRKWDHPTKILYAGKDNMTSRDTVESFAREHHVKLEVMEEGEHFFHTPEQLKVLRRWTEKNF